MQARRQHASQRPFSDLTWRFLSPPSRVTALPANDEPFLQPSFLAALTLQHTFDTEYVDPTENKILSLLTGETQRDDILDSLMNELHVLRSEQEKAPKNDHHDFSQVADAVPHEAPTVPSPPAKTRRLSIFRPEDMQMVKDTAHARIQGKLDLLQNEANRKKTPEDGPMQPERPTTPHILWRASDRVRLALDIPAELSGESPKINAAVSPATPQLCVTKKKAAYGAWYLPPKSWCKQTPDGARSRGAPTKKGMPSDTTKALALREQIPKLFIAREYRSFIESRNARMPPYLSEPT
ncbi:hypothetical protein SDRG_05095 [Saprolegnia diclina VS20]|uniref:Uncharacterized protein n=1 Tax=Saprolegnia diclina (strain VS20) TaxID=1156394 RepID=T0S499_SAPDV|nr:hypothetical protein SDRG_05095 [Saprolegnia diclina VS20]EQC37492.1 hypothetical protein SDRG_05095 [Saprolegnia diclina VS20]|eukprot:XP_008609012.1 hypothetical protein SDRG_05095 [Saprolegnia diclina VS20]